MCDYSLHTVKTRSAKIGDKLVTHNFGTMTRGFRGASDSAPQGAATAVCILPGTEIAFSKAVRVADGGIAGPAVARFTQVNKEDPCKHHDALEFPEGQIVLVTNLEEGQEATVLQLPAQPKTDAEREEQRRVEYVG